MPQRDLSILYMLPRHLTLLQSLLRQYVPDAEVWAYGSRVTGGAHDCSDIDLVLRHRDNVEQVPQGFTALEEALQNSTLPMLCDVHVWARLPVSFRENIQAAYVVVQE